MTIRTSRRGITAGAFAAIAGLVALTGCSSAASDEAGSVTESSVECETMQKSHLVTATANLDVSYIPYGILAKELGFFADECIDMEIEVTSNSAIQALLNEKTDFAMTSPDQLLMTVAETGGDAGAKIIHNIMPNLNIHLMVLADSDVESVEDLIGGTIGLESNSPMYDSFMTKSFEPYGKTAADANYIVTAYGATPVEALKNGDVDAVLYWPGMQVSWEEAGYELRVIPGTEWINDFDGIGIGARTATIEEDPELIEKVSRALARSWVYLQSNPEGAVRLFWEAYPERAPMPGENEEEAMQSNLNILGASTWSMGLDDKPADYTWGFQSEERWTNQIAYIQGSGMISADKTFNATDYFYADHIEAANDFDHAALQK